MDEKHPNFGKNIKICNILPYQNPIMPSQLRGSQKRESHSRYWSEQNRLNFQTTVIIWLFPERPDSKGLFY
jgi:hypothetical protein